MKQDNPLILACLNNIKALNAMSPSDQEAVITCVIQNKDWRGEFNVIHNLQEMLCRDLKHSLKGFREVKHAALTKPGPFALELAVIRQYIKQNPPHEVFAVLRRIKTPEVFSKEKALSHRALFTDLFGEEEAKKAFKWYPDHDQSLSA